LTKIDVTRPDLKVRPVPKVLKMPNEQQLPPGAWRTFVEELFVLYRAAERPSLREVAEAVNKIEARAGTASHETIRRALMGINVPRLWSTVEAMVLGICSIAKIDPNSTRHFNSWNGEETSFIEVIKDAWNLAIDEGRPVPRQRTTAFDEDPPF
jgi:hypothetical protein